LEITIALLIHTVHVFDDDFNEHLRSQDKCMILGTDARFSLIIFIYLIMTSSSEIILKHTFQSFGIYKSKLNNIPIASALQQNNACIWQGRTRSKHWTTETWCYVGYLGFCVCVCVVVVVLCSLGGRFWTTKVVKTNKRKFL
jgi:hypothetical protein